MKWPHVGQALKRVDPKLYYQQPGSREAQASDGDVSLRYLGTAGFVVEGADHTLVIDPFVSRPGLLATGLRRLQPDDALIEAVIPHADDVLIGHAHHDHILDAPSLCHRTGARLIGSPSTCNVGRAAGLPESQLVETRGDEDIVSGPATVRGLPSKHGRVYFNRVTLPGVIASPPPWPPRFRDLRHGLVLNWSVSIGGLRIVHIDSADFIDEALHGVGCDVLCLCAIGRAYRPNYVETAVRILQPRWVIACHWDWFFTPFRQEPRLLPGVDLPGFMTEIEAAGATPVVLPFDGVFKASGEGLERD